MIKKLLLFLLVSIFALKNVSAQDTIHPAGGYANLKALNSRTPSSGDTFSIIRRSSVNMKNYGGNDYNIVLNNDLNTVKKVWRRYFAIVSGDTLYLNCKKLDIGVGFTPVLVKGKYFAFKAYMPHNNTGAGQEVADAMIVGSVGARINSGPPAKIQTQFPFLWALNTATGDKTMLTYGGMIKLLEPFPDLKKHFMQNEGKDKDEVILDYVRKINLQ